MGTSADLIELENLRYKAPTVNININLTKL